MSMTPQHPSVRPYQADDATTTLRIFTTAITTTAAADYSQEQVQAWAQPRQRDAAGWHLAMHKRNSFVATVNGEVVGFSDVDEHGYIDMMFVAPEYQRQGVARALLEEAERQARELHATSLTADASLTARPFFERHGFSIERRQEPVKLGVKLVNYRMRKLLNEEHI